MRKKVFGGVLALTLAVPATALAGKVNLAGSVPDSGTITMTAKHSAKTGKTKVVNLVIKDAAISCGGTAYTFGADTSGFVFKVAKDGTFGATLVPTQTQHPQNKLKITGKLTQHRTKAVGTYSLKGDHVFTDSGFQDSCNTGVVDWTAKQVH
jgi:hypothetical protein